MNSKVAKNKQRDVTDKRATVAMFDTIRVDTTARTTLLLNATFEWQIYFSAFTICAQRDKPIDVTKMST